MAKKKTKSVKQSSSKNRLILIGLVILIALIGIRSQIYYNTLPSPTPTPSPKNYSVENSDKAGWKIFKNLTGGYSVEFPSSYTVETTDESNNIPVTDVNFIPKSFTERRDQNEFIGSIYIEKVSDKVPANSPLQEYYINNFIKKSFDSSNFKGLVQEDHENNSIFHVVKNSDTSSKTSETFVLVGNTTLEVLFQTGAGPQPQASSALNYSDYESIINSIKPL